MKPMYNAVKFAALALLAGMAATPASAGTTASADVSNFTVTLYDLNPMDSVTPSISFHLGFGGQGSFAQSSAIDPASGMQSGSGWSLVAFGPATSSSTAGMAGASASVSGSLLVGGVSFAAAGSALGSVLPGLSTQFSASATSSNNYPGLSFDLSPYTLVVFSGTASLQAQTTVGFDTSTYMSESASASVALATSGPGPAGGTGFQSASDNRNLYANYVNVYDFNTGQFTYTGQSLSLDDVALAASFTNYTAGLLTGNLSVSASVSGSTPMQPVPEPGTVAMLLAGLGMVGFMARRRRD